MRRRVLLISNNYANAGVIYKYVRNFADAVKDDVQIVIATHKTKVDVPDGCEMIQSFYIPTHWYEAIRFRCFGTYDSSVPDIMRYTVSPFLKRKLSKYISKNKVDVLHSFSFACSSHLIANKLKEKYGIPWVAHFLDAWIGNPYRNIKEEDRDKDADYERMVAQNADVIVHTNYVIAKQWIDRYGDVVKNKIKVIPLGYSLSVYDDLRHIEQHGHSHDKITITYIGTCAGERNLQTLIKALDILNTESPQTNNMLEVRVLGNKLPIDENLVQKLSLSEVVHFVGRKSGVELNAEYERADIFFVVDAPMKENIFFPSKLLDYFKYQKPVLGISPNIGVTNQLLRESGNYCFDNNDVKGVADYLRTAITDFQSLMNYDRNFYQLFLPESIADEYQKILSSLV